MNGRFFQLKVLTSLLLLVSLIDCGVGSINKPVSDVQHNLQAIQNHAGAISSDADKISGEENKPVVADIKSHASGISSAVASAGKSLNVVVKVDAAKDQKIEKIQNSASYKIGHVVVVAVVALLSLFSIWGLAYVLAAFANPAGLAFRCADWVLDIFALIKLPRPESRA